MCVFIEQWSCSVEKVILCGWLIVYDLDLELTWCSLFQGATGFPGAAGRVGPPGPNVSYWLTHITLGLSFKY